MRVTYVLDTMFQASMYRLMHLFKHNCSEPSSPWLGDAQLEAARVHLVNSWLTPSTPNSIPTVAALAWKTITVVEKRTVENFLQNLWAAQILLAEQKTWETVFWNNTVRRSNGTRYEPGFHDSYYTTKSSDNYPLIRANGTEWMKAGNTYSRAEVTKWLADPLPTASA